MIIVRSPLRVSLLGGGTDLPAFYKKRKGTVISFAISKYVYITINKLAESNDVLLKYSKLERVQRIEDIQHPIVRCALERFEVSGVDISITSDIPAGTGLGSSSSFTVGLIRALTEYKGLTLTKEEIAEKACEIEMIDLQEPIGKQDQYASSYGGVNQFVFNTNGKVDSIPILGEMELRAYILGNCLLLRIGSTRNSNSILSNQALALQQGTNLRAMSELCDLTEEFCSSLPLSISSLGQRVLESWSLKSQFAQRISNVDIENRIQTALNLGATGAKLLGAGQAGYLLIVFPSTQIRSNYLAHKSTYDDIIIPQIDNEGCKVIFRSESNEF